jgi:SAM-dependent methyltransferase
MVFCGELIEHMFDPDHLLKEIKRVLKPRGVCILTTPNLSSWANRIALLLGYQPFYTEVSTKFGVGHLFPFWLNAGHIRLFTYRAIRDLVKIYDLQVEEIYGVGINTKLGLGKKFFLITILLNKIFQAFPSFASDLIVVFRKK